MVFDEIPFRHSTPFIRKDATAGSNPGIPVAPPTAAPDAIPNWYMAGAHCNIVKLCKTKKVRTALQFTYTNKKSILTVKKIQIVKRQTSFTIL
jgi:hypothetical protein